MSDAENADDRLRFEIGEAFFDVRIDCQRKAGFGHFGNFAGFKSGGSDLGRFGKFMRIFGEMFARRDVAAAHVEETPGRHEISETVNAENARAAGAGVDEADKGAGKEH